MASAPREPPANGRRAAVTAGQWAPPTLPAAARGVGISAPPPEECQLFNMEPAVNNLQTLFQKAEADLDYIQSRLEFEIANSHPDDATAEENPAALLKEISLVKSRYKSLCDQMVQISQEQKESMESIRAALQETMKISRALQQQTGLEVSLPLSAEEQAATQQLNLQFGEEMELPVKEPFCSQSPVPGSAEEAQFTPLTKEAFLRVPRNIRRTVKLTDLNCLYRELFNHFIVQNNRAALSLTQMKTVIKKATNIKIQILKEMGIVEVDKQGNIKLAELKENYSDTEAS
ncbi:Spindle and kinetochore-associated protein 2 [Lonchura striata]|uniref:Protein FAM33A n=1 Tax=Lonchura striata TaxID=40157 RepID=A0A218UU97_9PASE|nr:spindle and kinetochore-associated protein 2 isoform X1 [Lonchura striata domestica]OWK57353.1 Spindle and kinetochore-associated protein 2 [Lonchura striata domestica]